MVASSLALLHPGRPKTEPNSAIYSAPKIEEAARLLGVSNSSVREANRVKREGVPALVKKVVAGDITLHEARKIAKLGAPAQAKIVAIDDRRERQRALGTAHNRSAGRAAAPRIDMMETVPGTVFVRDTLHRLDQITNQLLDAEGSSEAFVARFLSEFDWNEPILLQRLEHARRGIEAVARLQQELERRSDVA
jgi:hypothetical protein